MPGSLPEQCCTHHGGSCIWSKESSFFTLFEVSRDVAPAEVRCRVWLKFPLFLSISLSLSLSRSVPLHPEVVHVLSFTQDPRVRVPREAKPIDSSKI